MQTGVRIAVVISSVSFGAYGAGCFLSRRMVTEFERYRMSRFRTLTGALQMGASLGLLAGLADARLVPLLRLSAAGLAAMMFLAVLVRLRIRDPWPLALPAVGFLCLNAWIAASF